MCGNHIPCFFLILFLLVSQWCVISYGDDSPRFGPEPLLAKYHEVEKDLEKNSSTVPFHIESSANKNSTRVDVYGTVNYPFEIVQNEFLDPTNWCDIVMPHLDVRACTYKKGNDTSLLNIYHVNKSSETLDDAYLMKFVYRVSAAQPAYFDVALTTDDGPFHSKNHRFRLEAIPIQKNMTFIHLHYSFGYSALGYYFMNIFGGSKVGFSITGTDRAGNPVYVGGMRGSAERDVVCYYLAELAYLDALKAPPGQRFDRRINQWYDLSARFKKQLFGELKKEEYLKYKSQDRKSQQKLQGHLN
jgi:hypothetical protein